MAQPMLFEPISIRDVTLKNRVVVAPMHQYSAVKGFATDWHLMNAGRYAAGGAGLVIMESTKVERRGCGTLGDLGLWADAHVPGLARCVEFIRAHDCVAGIQLGHSGRKARNQLPWEGRKQLQSHPGVDHGEDWEIIGPSAIAQGNGYFQPRELTVGDIGKLIEEYGKAVDRAQRAGFDALEIHGAHGYLLHQFLSPAANHRTDAYGGAFRLS
jgi:2,4-dienoyl-CoA reductase-like NADH-dependent reductase (Old Yellow Enzyme family)